MSPSRRFAVLAEREINWRRRRDEAVQLISGVAWGESES